MAESPSVRPLVAKGLLEPGIWTLEAKTDCPLWMCDREGNEAAVLVRLLRIETGLAATVLLLAGALPWEAGGKEPDGWRVPESTVPPEVTAALDGLDGMSVGDEGAGVGRMRVLWEGDAEDAAKLALPVELTRGREDAVGLVSSILPSLVAEDQDEGDVSLLPTEKTAAVVSVLDGRMLSGVWLNRRLRRLRRLRLVTTCDVGDGDGMRLAQGQL